MFLILFYALFFVFNITAMQNIPHKEITIKTLDGKEKIISVKEIQEKLPQKDLEDLKYGLNTGCYMRMRKKIYYNALESGMPTGGCDARHKIPEYTISQLEDFKELTLDDYLEILDDDTIQERGIRTLNIPSSLPVTELNMAKILKTFPCVDIINAPHNKIASITGLPELRKHILESNIAYVELNLMNNPITIADAERIKNAVKPKITDLFWKYRVVSSIANNKDHFIFGSIAYGVIALGVGGIGAITSKLLNLNISTKTCLIKFPLLIAAANIPYRTRIIIKRFFEYKPKQFVIKIAENCEI